MFVVVFVMSFVVLLGMCRFVGCRSGCRCLRSSFVVVPNRVWRIEHYTRLVVGIKIRAFFFWVYSTRSSSSLPSRIFIHTSHTYCSVITAFHSLEMLLALIYYYLKWKHCWLYAKILSERNERDEENIRCTGTRTGTGTSAHTHEHGCAIIKTTR